MENDPPYNSEVQFIGYNALDGWFAEKLNLQLRKIIHKASRNFYKNDAHSFGEGASIPFLKVLGDRVLYFIAFLYKSPWLLVPGSLLHRHGARRNGLRGARAQ